MRSPPVPGGRRTGQPPQRLCRGPRQRRGILRLRGLCHLRGDDRTDFLPLRQRLRQPAPVGHRVRRRLRHPPLGAILIGAYADRAGRKPAMLLTLFLMALGTGGIAVLPGYDSIGPAAPLLLVLTRLLQGLAWGGEAGPATTYILEAAPPHKRGTYACWQVVAQGIAAVAAGLMGYLLTLWLDERQLQEWGWRIPFAAGLLVLPIGLYIRLNLAETFSGRGRQASTRSLLGELFGNHRRALLLGLLILSGSTITQYFLNYMTTFALTELHLPAGIAMLSTLVAGAALALSALLGGVLCDRYGRRAVLILPRLALLAVLFPALQAMTRHPEPAVFLAVLALLSALHGMSGAALIVLLVESFPGRCAPPVFPGLCDRRRRVRRHRADRGDLADRRHRQSAVAAGLPAAGQPGLPGWGLAGPRDLAGSRGHGRRAAGAARLRTCAVRSSAAGLSRATLGTSFIRRSHHAVLPALRLRAPLLVRLHRPGDLAGRLSPGFPRLAGRPVPRGARPVLSRRTTTALPATLEPAARRPPARCPARVGQRKPERTWHPRPATAGRSPGLLAGVAAGLAAVAATAAGDRPGRSRHHPGALHQPPFGAALAAARGAP